MPLPTGIQYGTVVGEFILAVDDGPDADLYPDAQPASGAVIFTPSIPKVVINNKIVFLRPITAVLNTSGQMSVNLVATNSLNINPVNFTYQVTIQLTQVFLPSFSIVVPAGETVDLSGAVAVSPSEGIYVPPSSSSGSGFDGGNF